MSFPPWYWFPPRAERLERTIAEILADRIPKPIERVAVSSRVLDELSDSEVKRLLQWKTMGLPLRLCVAKTLHLTPDELDVYEGGRSIGDGRIALQIHEARKTPAEREAGDEDA